MVACLSLAQQGKRATELLGFVLFCFFLSATQSDSQRQRRLIDLDGEA